MNRRTYLLGCTAAATSLAGCAGENEELLKSVAPDLTVSSTENSEGRIRELSRSGNEYSLELKNQGIAGTVLAELYFAADGVQSSSPAASREPYLEAGERTELTLTADQPAWANKYGFETRGTRFVANVRNTGSEAEVKVSLVDLPGSDTVVSKTVTIGAEETRLVEFHTDYEFTDDYEIQAVLADV